MPKVEGIEESFFRVKYDPLNHPHNPHSTFISLYEAYSDVLTGNTIHQVKDRGGWSMSIDMGEEAISFHDQELMFLAKLKYGTNLGFYDFVMMVESIFGPRDGV